MGQFALQVVVSLISLDPVPRGLNHANHCLPAGMHVNMLHGDLLLPLAPVAITRPNITILSSIRLNVLRAP